MLTSAYLIDERLKFIGKETVKTNFENLKLWFVLIYIF